jgi:hypothetical protein
MTDSAVHFSYKADVLAQLALHGVRPLTTTRPELVHELISDLYRYEIRRMRQRLIRGEFVRSEYFGRIVELRRKYPLVSLKPHDFVD